MITSIEIRGLRGIREGRIDGLAPLTMIVGPNGCGKAAVVGLRMEAGVLDPLVISGPDAHQRVLEFGHDLRL